MESLDIPTRNSAIGGRADAEASARTRSTCALLADVPESLALARVPADTSTYPMQAERRLPSRPLRPLLDSYVTTFTRVDWTRVQWPAHLHGMSRRPCGGNRQSVYSRRWVMSYQPKETWRIAITRNLRQPKEYLGVPLAVVSRIRTNPLQILSHPHDAPPYSPDDRGGAEPSRVSGATPRAYRPAQNNMWLTFAISPSPPGSASPKRMLSK